MPWQAARESPEQTNSGTYSIIKKQMEQKPYTGAQPPHLG